MIKIDGTYLKNLRLSHGYSLRKLAEVLYVSKSTVFNWEQNNSLDSLDIIQKICDLYQIPLSEFLRNSQMEKDLSVPKDEVALSEVNDIPAKKGKSVKKKKLSAVFKTGIITFIVCNVLILIFAAFVYLYIYVFTADSTYGSRIQSTFNVPGLLILYFAFTLIPSGVAMLIHKFIQKIKSKERRRKL